MVCCAPKWMVGLVFVETTRELIALDMCRSDESIDAVLWRHSLSLEPVNPTRQHTPQSASPETNLLGMRTYSRGADRDTIVGPVTPAGILIQKNSELISLDALSGQPLWSRRGYDNTTTLLSHGLEVAVVRRKTAKIDVLDCRDGSLLRQIDQPEPWKALWAAGKHIVQMKPKNVVKKGGILVESADACDVRMLDVFNGKEVCNTSLPRTRRPIPATIATLWPSKRVVVCGTAI